MVRVRRATTDILQADHGPLHGTLGIVEEFDVTPDPTSRLRTKVMIFKSRKAMLAFARSVIGAKVHRGIEAAVRELACSIMNEAGEEIEVEVDPRYVCLAIFNLRDLSYCTIAHEGIHVGFNYARRTGKTKPWTKGYAAWEEAVAYPAGMFTALVLLKLHQLGYRPLED